LGRIGLAKAKQHDGILNHHGSYISDSLEEYAAVSRWSDPGSPPCIDSEFKDNFEFKDNLFDHPNGKLLK
jgi:hypothetical protein